MGCWPCCTAAVWRLASACAAAAAAAAAHVWAMLVCMCSRRSTESTRHTPVSTKNEIMRLQPCLFAGCRRPGQHSRGPNASSSVVPKAARLLTSPFNSPSNHKQKTLTSSQQHRLHRPLRSANTFGTADQSATSRPQCLVEQFCPAQAAGRLNTTVGGSLPTSCWRASLEPAQVRTVPHSPSPPCSAWSALLRRGPVCTT